MPSNNTPISPRSTALHHLIALTCWAAFLTPAALVSATDQDPQQQSSAAAPQSAIMANTSVWEVNTRSMPSCDPNHVAMDQWKVKRRTDAHQWADSNVQSLIESCRPDVPCVVFVHGNLTDAYWGTQDGISFLKSIDRQTEQPMQLIIWSWPSQRMRPRLKPDTQIKARRADVEGVYLARLIRNIRTRTPLTLVGYSFGARATCGATQLLAGGRVGGYELIDACDDASCIAASGCHEHKMRLVLIGAAIDQDWLVRGRRYGKVLDFVCEVFVTRNPNDNVLRWYPLMYGLCGPQAMGRVGPVTSASDLKNLQVIPLGCPKHDLIYYLSSSRLVGMLDSIIFADCCESCESDDAVPSVAVPTTAVPKDDGTTIPEQPTLAKPLDKPESTETIELIMPGV